MLVVTGNKSLSVLFLVLMNLIPIGGVLFFGWSVYEVLFLFWAESLIIGGFNVARFWTLYKRRNDGMMLIMIPFFCMHYGTFLLVHLVFLNTFFSPDDSAEKLPFYGYLLPFLGLIASHGYSYAVNFLRAGEYQKASWKELMVAPYQRILAMQATLLVGGALVMFLGEQVIALAILVAIKIVIDISAHRKEHRNKASQELNTAEQGEAAERSSVFPGWESDTTSKSRADKRE